MKCDSDNVTTLIWMRSFHVGNTVPDDPPRPAALTPEFGNEVRLMGHQHARVTVVLVVDATVDCQVSATRNVYRLVYEIDSPIGVVGKALREAVPVCFDANS